jgi:hypothetical protein
MAGLEGASYPPADRTGPSKPKAVDGQSNPGSPAPKDDTTAGPPTTGVLIEGDVVADGDRGTLRSRRVGDG